MYQTIVAFVVDKLQQASRRHEQRGQLPEHEELSPIVENLIVLKWLKKSIPGYLNSLKQNYGTELRSRTLAIIKSEISQALTSLLDEIHGTDNAKMVRAEVSN